MKMNPEHAIEMSIVDQRNVLTLNSHLPSGEPVPLSELLSVARSLHVTADRWANVVIEVAPRQGNPIECPGCGLGHCCRMPLFSTMIDALPVAVELDHFGLNDLEYRRELRRVGDLHERAIEMGTEEVEPIACPFLTRENRCFMYKNRPPNCRTYLVTGGKDACTPRAMRADGLRPKVGTVDSGMVTKHVLKTMGGFAAYLGWPERAQYSRAHALLVAMWLEVFAVEMDDPWGYVRDQCVLPMENFMRMVHRQAGKTCVFFL